jgi:hypothetical protein
VRLRLVPHFALGPVADVSSPASPGGDPLVVRVGDVNGRLDVRGSDISDICVTPPSCRVMGRVVTGGGTDGGSASGAKRREPVSYCTRKHSGMERVLTEECPQVRIRCRH